MLCPETMVTGETPAVAPAYSSHGGVSHKIQQLLNTLKRPRKSRKPVEDYYHDDEVPGEGIANELLTYKCYEECLTYI